MLNLPIFLHTKYVGFESACFLAIMLQDTANFPVMIFTTASCDKILRRSPDVEFTSDSCTQLRDVIWIKYISTTTEEM